MFGKNLPRRRMWDSVLVLLDGRAMCEIYDTSWRFRIHLRCQAPLPHTNQPIKTMYISNDGVDQDADEAELNYVGNITARKMTS